MSHYVACGIFPHPSNAFSNSSSDLGKRIRRERDALNFSPSVETIISSSIIPNSQFSQRLSQLLPIPKSTTIHKPSEQLLTLLKRYVNIPPIHHAASQGSRGVPVFAHSFCTFIRLLPPKFVGAKFILCFLIL